MQNIQMYKDFAGIYDPLMRDVDYDMWAEYVYSLLDEDIASVAELGCGTGEITVRLSKRGLNVTGMDISEEMLMVAAEKARKRGLRIPFIRQDMRRFSLHRQADAVVSCCDGVNYLTDPGDVSAFLMSAYNALKPRGLLLFDVSSEHKLRDLIGDATMAFDDDERAYIWYNSYDADTRLITMELTFFVREGELYRRFEETHIQRAHTAEELMRLMREAGFEPQCYDAFTGEPAREDSERLQFVGRKL